MGEEEVGGRNRPSPPPALCPVIWRQAEIAEPRRSTTVYSASEGRGRGHVTVFTSSLTSCGWSSLAGIQWLHQTLLTHILSCLIGKAIKHESSRAPRLCMTYSEFFGFLADYLPFAGLLPGG